MRRSIASSSISADMGEILLRSCVSTPVSALTCSKTAWARAYSLMLPFFQTRESSAMQFTPWDNPMGTDGFEFIEYAAPDPVAMGQVFERMGFRKIARHRHK